MSSPQDTDTPKETPGTPEVAPEEPAKKEPAKKEEAPHAAKKEVAPPPPQSKKISNEVESAIAKFENLKLRLEALIRAARDHHTSMLAFNESRIEEARRYELLLNKSPLEVITGETNYTPPKKEAETEAHGFTMFKPGMTPPRSARKTTEKKTEGTEGNTFRAVVVDDVLVKKRDFSDIEATLGAVNRAAYDLTTQYAEKKSYMFTYVEEWNKAVTSKVQGRTIEYKKLQESMNYYDKKVKKMREDIAATEKKGKKVQKKVSERMDRNEIKLESAREAHDEYGETFVLLLEEITERGWRDAYPLLLMQLKSQANYYADQAKIFAHLEGATEALTKIGEDNEVVEGGRLKSIKEKRPEEIYTGDREVIDMPKKQATKGDVAAEKPPAVEFPDVDFSEKKESPAKESPSKESPAKDSPSKESPAKESPSKESPADESAEKESAAEESPADESNDDEAESPAKEPVGTESPVKEPPEEESAEKESPVEESAAKQSPVADKLDADGDDFDAHCACENPVEQMRALVEENVAEALGAKH